MSHDFLRNTHLRRPPYPTIGSTAHGSITGSRIAICTARPPQGLQDRLARKWVRQTHLRECRAMLPGARPINPSDALRAQGDRPLEAGGTAAVLALLSAARRQHPCAEDDCESNAAKRRTTSSTKARSVSEIVPSRTRDQTPPTVPPVDPGIRQRQGHAPIQPAPEN